MLLPDLREQCCAANILLPKTGLVDLTFGNVSVLDAGRGIFAIKPSGVDYGDLTPESIVLVDLDGKIVEGDLRPSSDTPTHRRLFRAFAQAGILSIVHTHSRTAVAFAQAAREIPCLGTTHSDHFYGPVPITRAMTEHEVQGDYEWETGNVILERFSNIHPLEVPAVLVRYHGPFAWAATPAKAVETALALEVIAEMAWKTLSLDATCPDLPRHIMEKHFRRKHGTNAYYGQRR